MLSIIARALLALLGAGALFVAASVWYDPEALGSGLGLAAIGDLGLATLRGDLGTLFGSSGAFMLAAAALADRRLIVPPLIFTSVALAGRTLSLALNEYAPALVAPMLVESIAIIVLVAAYVMLERDAASVAAAVPAPPEPASAA
jgi:hypothetical protein